ncbi:MFS transporter [Streptomyces gamaensis]|uniref:MFS transporter n=1 Tax=Streptomyces gamaensis TaxID=1763542 RepID=A0ABW0YYR2_9ACTN
MSARPSSPPAVRAWPVLLVVSSAIFMVMLDNLAVNNALPQLGDQLAVGFGGLQWVVATYTAALAALLLSGSVVGERLGRRRVFLAGLVVFAAGSALCALAGGWAALVAGRAVQAAGGAVLLPTSTALVRQVFTEERRRARAIGVRGAASGLGLALGPVVGGPLVEGFGWRGVFWINVPVALAAFLVGLRTLPEAPGREVRWDPWGQALAALGLGGLVYGLVQGPVEGWTGGRVPFAFVVAACALPALVVVELRGAAPMLQVRFFRDPVCAAAALACFATAAGLFGAIFFASLYLQYVLGWSPAGAGLVFLLASVCIVVSAPVAGLVSGRRGPRGPLLAGLALCPVALLGLSWYGTQARYGQYWWLLPLIGGCVGLTFVPVTVTVVQRVRAERAAMASAVVDMLRELGGVVGVAGLGAVLNSGLRSSLSRQATDAGLPSALTRRLVGVVSDGGPAAGLRVAGDGAEVVRVWVADAFVEGLHAALRTGAAATALAALAVALLLRAEPVVRPPRQATADGAYAPPPVWAGLGVLAEVCGPDGARFVLRALRQAEAAAPVVVLLPAMGTPARFYLPFVRQLHERGLTVVTADLRGHGESTPAVRRGVCFGYREMAEWDVTAVLSAVRSALPRAPLVVLGHSLGGHLALLHAAAHGPRPDGLVLVGTGSSWYRGCGGLSGLRNLVLLQLCALGARALGYWPGRRFGFGGTEAAGVLRDCARQARRDGFRLLGSTVDYERALRELDLPVLAVSVEGDRMFPRRASEHLLGKIPRAALTRRHYARADAEGRRLDHFRWVHSGAVLAEWVAQWAYGPQVRPREAAAGEADSRTAGETGEKPH